MFDEFKTDINDNLKKILVMKSFDNSGMKIVKESEIVYNDIIKLIQEFVKNLLLIDGRVF